MAEKKATTKNYTYVGNHPRSEQGKRVTYGDIVDLSHLKAETIKELARLGYYREVK